MRYLFARVRIRARGLNNLIFSRTHHSVTGRFTTISSRGTPVTQEIEVWLGDPGSAYVMFDPQVSRAFQTEAILHGGCSLAQDQELYPLNFYHDTRHFSHKSSPYPRLEIPQDLPRQSNANTSLATLHANGVTLAITLDGTPDADFEHSIGESIKRLQPVLNKLKDM